MASEATTDSVPLTADGAAEASTSALPNGSSTAAPGAEGPTIALFNPLYGAKDSLHHQSENTAQLHPLNSSLQSIYSASSADGRLSRDQYRQLIAQIRHSVSQFAATNPALQPQPPSTQNSADASIANQMRRYISLLTETSTHTAALAHSVAPIKTAKADWKDAASYTATSAPFPPQLQAGVFRTGSSDKSVSSWTCAVETLAALCQTLENAAKALGLETFSEPSSEAAEVRSDSTSSSTPTHSLTLGAKILVIDIELHILNIGEARGLSPKAKLKISYANDSADSHQARDPRLGAILERDVQLIADHLFGSASSDSPQQGRIDVARALTNWTDNLKDLLLLDDLEAAASQAASSESRSTDLFAAMQDLCSAAVRVADAEASSSISAAALLDRGHGHHKLHGKTPFLQCIYAHDPTSQQDYTLSLGIQALDLPVADQVATDTQTPSFPLSQSAHDILTSYAASDRLNSLGSVPSAANPEKRIPLHFVVRLSPPAIVTRPTAAKLAFICNLKHLSPHNTNPVAPGGDSTSATWFEDVLASSWSRRPSQPEENARRSTRCTFTLAQTVESVRSTQSQGLVIDTLPLLSAPLSSPDAMDDGSASQASASPLTRLFAAIEVLRDEVKVTELMHSAIASSESAAEFAGSSQDQADDVSLDDLLASAGSEDSGKIAVTIAFRTPVQGAIDEAQRNLSLQLAFRVISDAGATVTFDACISPSKTSSELGWLLSAVARSEASASTGSNEVHLDNSSSEAQSIVAKLVDFESLEDVVIGIIDWAEKQLGLQLKKPSAASAKFDALSYEQQNVHAIYETIAPHFSNTRYKPWPLIPAFLNTIPQGSLGADLGCGNGKYLPIRSTLALPSAATDSDSKRQDSLLTIGVDRSSNLISLAQHNFGTTSNDDATKSLSSVAGRRQEVAVGDAIRSSLRSALFDYAISIATIHHFSTWERRRASVQEMIRLIAPVYSVTTLHPSVVSTDQDPRMEGGVGSGRFMIFVWALEQKDEGKRQFQADDPKSLGEKREIHDPNHEKSKDRLVSYSGLQNVLGTEADAKVTDDQDVLVPWVLTTANAKKKPKERKSGKGRKKDQAIEEGMSGLNITPDAGQAEHAEKPEEDSARPVYNRYYHMFRSGELEALVEDAARTMPAVHRRDGKVEEVEVRETSPFDDDDEQQMM
ncbi:hypothetical protein PHSY_000390 [Pseudozyma hubeiensis SY62]|uniref:Uncharacterized protein n=1 Tax=Pseudozyma hubeiensis (strain SY62) TaxID=1305764 RepID=R9NWA4_PSEHS|nr:hypothetical protein PHSY_000390 [Pseudozyma hubeiensis SY62]GAC92833.1 hypothetical protein PHSY_000390 [Pseudozyma hubeiensis SY62]